MGEYSQKDGTSVAGGVSVNGGGARKKGSAGGKQMTIEEMRLNKKLLKEISQKKKERMATNQQSVVSQNFEVGAAAHLDDFKEQE